MEIAGRLLLAAGIALAVLGLLFILLAKLGAGSLPGDLARGYARR